MALSLINGIELNGIEFTRFDQALTRTFGANGAWFYA